MYYWSLHKCCHRANSCVGMCTNFACRKTSTHTGLAFRNLRKIYIHREFCRTLKILCNLYTNNNSCLIWVLLLNVDILIHAEMFVPFSFSKPASLQHQVSQCFLFDVILTSF